MLCEKELSLKGNVLGLERRGFPESELIVISSLRRRRRRNPLPRDYEEEICHLPLTGKRARSCLASSAPSKVGFNFKYVSNSLLAAAEFLSPIYA